MKGRPLLSSTPLQILFMLNSYFLGFFILSEILLVVYKVETLVYPTRNLSLDIILILFLLILEVMRIFIGSKGNLTEKAFTSIIAVILLFSNALIVFYLIFWQTYVLRIDTVLCACYFVFLGLQLLFGVISIASFARAKVVS